ncbi:hypothetical protein CGCSCA1_v003697 [Colletotrichum siamense]|nr:hypothetical protein CGCSCA1_v003697 [Colletotrichum siamense]
MATPITRAPSEDDLSSPDPLNDNLSSALYPSTNRVTRSQRSQRLFSVGGPGTSPRKQMFELEVGDNRKPQRLLVTVEAEDEYENVGRRLFNAQTPSLRRGTTTTTIPLGGDKRATAIKTPARRGRPPKNATPGPSGAGTGTTTRKRKGTPRGTPRPARKPKIGDSDDLNSDMTIPQGTPKSIMRRPRGSSRQGSTDPAPSTTRRRGRPRKVDFNPDETIHTIEDFDQVVPPSDDVLAAGMQQMDVDSTPAREQPTENVPESDGDIWMATMDDETTPRPRNHGDTSQRRISSPSHPQKSPTPFDSDDGNEPAYDNYDFGPGPASDISSLVGDDAHPSSGSRDRDMDTVAQGEDFSMIFANSIPSLKSSMGVQASGPEDFGDETNMIINQTLESLRQSGALRPDDEDEEDEVVGIPTQRAEESRMEVEHDVTLHTSPSTRIEALMDSLVDNSVDINNETIPDVTGEVNVESIVDMSAVTHSPVDLPSLLTPRLRAPSSAAGSDGTPSKGNQSPAWIRSSPRRKSIPLGRKLLESKARQMDDSFSSIPSKILAAATPAKKTSRRSLTSRRSSGVRRSSMANEEDSAAYEDDFSEIPEEYLEAATPGRTLQRVDETEVNEEEEAEVDAQEDRGMEEVELAEEEPPKPSPTKSADRSNANVFTRSDSSRMLTPDDTLSSNEVPVPDSDGKTIDAPQTSPLAEQSQLPGDTSKVRSEGRSRSRSSSSAAGQHHLPAESSPLVSHSYLPEQRSSSPMAEETFLPDQRSSPIAGQTFLPDQRSSSPVAEQTHLPEGSSPPVVDQSHYPERSSSPAAEEADEPVAPPERNAVRRNSVRSSSLPVGDLTTNLPRTANEYITPVGPASSPIPAPTGNLLAPRAPSPEAGFRPTLSPIVRAGRALQSVTSDASSPPRQNSLGSPFRPTTSSSQLQPQSASKPRNSWTQPLSNLIQAGAQFFQSPTRLLAQPSVPQSVNQSQPPYEDPFGAEDSHIGQPSFMEALAKSVRSSSPSRATARPRSMSGSLRAAPADEADEMSWMQEEPAPREQPFAPSRSVNSSMDAIGNSFGSQQRSFEARPNLEAQRSFESQPGFERQDYDAGDETEVEEQEPEEEEEPEEDYAEEEEDDDIWAVEASRPASQSSRQRDFGKQSVQSIPARRAAPSPWKRGPESPKKPPVFTPAASRAHDLMADDAEIEDFSMLSQQRSRQKQIPHKALNMAQHSSAKKDLSAFFSSPALLPGTEGVRDILDAKKRQNALAQRDLSQPAERFPGGLETNSMFPSVPQKAFNPSQSGRSDLFSPAKSSAVKTASAAINPDVQNTRRELFASSRSRPNMRHQSEIPDSQPAMSSEISFLPVAQKQNFTPRSGQKTNNLFAKAAAPVPSLTPVRMQLTRADIKKWQEDSASAIAEDSPESPRRSSLRPLPDRNMSPPKSCLRSPLKPRTPGRVVEFTSSVLSPLAQAQARAERRMSASSSGSAAGPAAVSFAPQRSITIIEEDKENDVSEENEEMDVSMTDVPQADLSNPPKPVEKRLSQTMWSRDHWLLMDELIHLRRRGPFNFRWPAGFQSKSGWLLGKSVNSHGSSLLMEQWHLDVVDAFKAEVGGWDEEVLAKRAFSLIVGERLRREQRAPKAPSVKFV